MSDAPPWTVLLLGGASGVGKSAIADDLAEHFGASTREVDDVYTALVRMTTSEQYPPIHLWEQHPEVVLGFDDRSMLEHTLENAAVMAEALEPVIADHLGSSRRPVVFEGDFILPSMAAKASFDDEPASGRVRGLFLLEDEEQLGRNFATREGEEQPRRARAAWCYSEWLRQECSRLGVPAIPARPWETVLARALEATSGNTQ